MAGFDCRVAHLLPGCDQLLDTNAITTNKLSRVETARLSEALLGPSDRLRDLRRITAIQLTARRVASNARSTRRRGTNQAPETRSFGRDPVNVRTDFADLATPNAIGVRPGTYDVS